MVIHRLAGRREMAIALGLGLQRAHLLRVAADAAFADIDIPAHQPQRRIRSDARIRLGGGVLEEQRHDLDQTRNADHEDRADDQPADVLLQRFVGKESLFVGHLSILD
ncbi:hypothetical protein D3C72_1917500 [compost metagenome]